MKSEKRLIDANRLIQDINADPYRTESEKSYVRCLVSRQLTVDAIVLPCTVDESVYRIYDDCDLPGDCSTKRMCKGCEYRNLFIEEQAFCLSMLQQNGNLGHPYYLTREEAEAAMAERGNHGE